MAYFFARKAVTACKITFLSVCVAFLCVCCALGVICEKNESAVDVFTDTIRLRVVANSNADGDIALKYAVRDGIIGLAEELFSDCKSVDEAILTATENMELIREKARLVVRENGKNDEVCVCLVTEDCPIRRYSDFVFPAGRYLTLRVDLGRAEGENWWCVMYPPLCLSTATDDVYADVAVFKSHGFSDEQIAELRRPTKKIRFALLELFS